MNRELLTLSGVSKSFGGIEAIRGCTMGVERGLVTGLIGPNGAGKTTLFNIITGFLRADRGDITYDGRDIGRLSPEVIAKLGIVRSFQNLRLWSDMSVLDNVLLALNGHFGESLWGLFANWRGVEEERLRNVLRAQAILEDFGLVEKMHERVDTLGYAEQKVLSLARITASDATFLLLDEPASGLDGIWLDKLSIKIRQLAKEGRTVLLIEHNFELIAALSDVIYFLDRGELIRRGSSAEIRSDKRLHEVYFGT